MSFQYYYNIVGNRLRGIYIKKHNQLIQCISCLMIFLFVCSAILPICNAKIITPQTNGEKMFLESSVKKVKQINYENESNFDYAIIWGTFEEKWYSSLFGFVHVFNRGPWHNRTMNVIGYQGWTGNWTVKKASYVKCNFLHLGIVGRNWLCVIGIRNVDAW